MLKPTIATQMFMTRRPFDAMSIISGSLVNRPTATLGMTMDTRKQSVVTRTSHFTVMKNTSRTL